jgi:hypothetical protein
MIGEAGLIPFQYNEANGTTGLYLKATVKDITDRNSIVDLSDVPMTDLLNGVYAGDFTGVAGKNYSISMKVYLDSGYTTLDPNYATGDKDIQCVSVGVPQSLIDSIQVVLGAIAANLTSELEDNGITSEINTDPELGC